MTDVATRRGRMAQADICASELRPEAPLLIVASHQDSIHAAKHATGIDPHGRGVIVVLYFQC